jgi:hypothetical protein
MTEMRVSIKNLRFISQALRGRKVPRNLMKMKMYTEWRSLFKLKIMSILKKYSRMLSTPYNH